MHTRTAGKSEGVLRRRTGEFEEGIPDLFVCNYVYDHLDEGKTRSMDYRNVFSNGEAVQLGYHRALQAVTVSDHAFANVPHKHIEKVRSKAPGAYILCRQSFLLSAASLCGEYLLYGY